MRSITLNKMRVWVVLAGVVLGCVLPSLSGGASRAYAEERRTLYVGVYENKPLVFVDADGVVRGVFIDILEAIALKEKWQLKYVFGSFSECLDRLEEGRLDLLVCIAPTYERESTLDFSNESVISNWGSIYTHSIEVSSFLDLHGKRIAGEKSDVYFSELQLLLKSFGVESEFVPTTSYADVLLAVERKEVDAGVVARLFGHANARDYNVRENPLAWSPIELGYAVPEGKNADILQAINAHLHEMKENKNSVFYRSLQRWFEDLQFHVQVIPQWLWVAIGGLIAVLLTFIGGNIVLNYKVKQKTKDLREEVFARKKAEQEVIRHRDNLEELVIEQTAELRRALSVKSEFTSMVSHELRTPLTAIKGGIDTLIKGAAGTLSAEQKGMLDLIGRNVERLHRLINEVLDFQKHDAGKVKMNFVDTDLLAIVEEAVTTMKPAADLKGLFLKTQYRVKKCIIECDHDYIMQVLLNLINNGIKFTEKGGVAISVINRKSYAEVCVKDTGCGIMHDDISKLFQSFIQLPNTMNGKTSGTGLGLAISQRIVERHHGRIWVESELGKGAAFYFTLARKI